ncbi:hypothetical protein D3C85_766030 [compost metagenome]
MALAFADLAVGGEALAGFHHQQVTQLQGGYGHLFLAAIAQARGAFWTQGFQGADGGAGLALGAAFQVLAQQHQGNHHGRGFEVQVRHDAVRGRGPFVETQAVAGAGADGHQQVHVAGAGFHRLPGGAVEARAEDELHGSGQGELHPGRQHPVQAEPLQQHGHHQWQGQGEGQQHRPALTLQAGCGVIGRRLVFVDQAGRVAGGLHGLDQARGFGLAEEIQVGALAGQVHRHLGDARHLAQGALDATGAAGAGHAAYGQFEALGRHLVAGGFDGRHQGRQAVAGGLHAGLFGGQVYAGGLYPRHLGQGTLDAAGAAGAGHPGDGQVESGWVGHG